MCQIPYGVPSRWRTDNVTIAGLLPLLFEKWQISPIPFGPELSSQHCCHTLPSQDSYQTLLLTNLGSSFKWLWHCSQFHRQHHHLSNLTLKSESHTLFQASLQAPLLTHAGPFLFYSPPHWSVIYAATIPELWQEITGLQLHLRVEV
jgi:hypothetical protein